MRSARSMVQVAFVWVIAACASCTGNVGGAVGENGVARFYASYLGKGADSVFSAPVVVGSAFSIRVSSEDEEVSLKGAKLVAEDELLHVDDDSLSTGRISIKGSGKTALLVKRDDKTLDRLVLQTRDAVATTLVDTTLLSETDVDARLPQHFAVLADTAIVLSVAAVVTCNVEGLDVGASTLSDESGAFAITPSGVATFELTSPAATGSYSLTLNTPGLKALTYDVDVVEAADVDEVRAAVAAVEQPTANVWGRAFANDVELMSPLSFSFSASERVTLSAAAGRSTVATISFPAQNEAPDDRPATLTAELFGEDHTVDFLTLTEGDLEADLGTPARAVKTDDAAASTPSCEDTTSDTCAAGAFCAVLLRKKRRVLARTQRG